MLIKPSSAEERDTFFASHPIVRTLIDRFTILAKEVSGDLEIVDTEACACVCRSIVCCRVCDMLCRASDPGLWHSHARDSGWHSVIGCSLKGSRTFALHPIERYS